MRALVPVRKSDDSYPDPVIGSQYPATAGRTETKRSTTDCEARQCTFFDKFTTRLLHALHFDVVKIEIASVQ
jgi:hypothetical protein